MGFLNCSDSKAELRKKHKNIRKLMNRKEKLTKDFKIFRRFINSNIFLKSDIILTYVSTKIEVNTIDIIKYSLNIGKLIAVPVSVIDGCILNFYFINSIDELKVGGFSILEPNKDRCCLCDVSKLTNFLCIVPGLVFDYNGYRIGYGKGFYDRFLKENKCETVGFCYETDIVKSISKDKYDVPVDFILTEKRILKTAM